MPADDSPAYLVARFLSANNYEKTLDAFIAEANLPPDAGSLPTKNALTLESILEEKRQFDKSQAYTKHGSSDESRGWTPGAPSVPQIISSQLPYSENLLCVNISTLRLQLDASDVASLGWPARSSADGEARTYLLASAAGRHVHVLSVQPGASERAKQVEFVACLPLKLLNAPVLSIVRVDADRIVLTTMSGLVWLQNLKTGRGTMQRHHKRYVVKAAVYRDCPEGSGHAADGDGHEEGNRVRDGVRKGRVWLATAGWDARVLLYRLSYNSDEEEKEEEGVGLGGGRVHSTLNDDHVDELRDPVAEIKLPTNPETVLFARDPDTGRVFLIVSRQDSSSIYYYLLPGQSGSSTSPASAPATAAAAAAAAAAASTTTGSINDNSLPSPPLLTQAGSQNLSPHSTAWISFSPAAMALSPTDPTLLGVATSSQPHMRVIFVRLLFPPSPPSSSSSSTTTLSTTTTTTTTASASTSTPIPTASEPSSRLTQSSQARAQLALQDREEAALQAHAAVMAPQTAYSTPQIAWRPDGSGVFVNGDDGVVRCVEAATARVVATLSGGHEPGTKIRSLWAGWVGGGGGGEGGGDRGDGEGGGDGGGVGRVGDGEVEKGTERQEWLVTGGFDQRLVVWRPS